MSDLDNARRLVITGFVGDDAPNTARSERKGVTDASVDLPQAAARPRRDGAGRGCADRGRHLDGPSGQTASAPDVSTVTATRGDVVVTVGGVGRIVTGSGSSIELPSSGGSSSANGTGTTSTSSTSVPADAVFARATGHVVRLLVKPGQHVTAGEPLARLDDDGVSEAAVQQAQLDLQTTRIELDQKLHNDPQKGIPPTAAEIAAAHAASARPAPTWPR